MHVYLNRLIQSLYNFCTSKDYTDSSINYVNHNNEIECY